MSRVSLPFLALIIVAAVGCSEQEPQSLVVSPASERLSPNAATEPSPARSAVETAVRAAETYEVYSGVVKRRDEPPVITRAKFDQVQDGVTYEHAVQIIGMPADVVVDDVNGPTGASRRTATWYNSDGSSATLTFLNMRLGVKHESGLR